MKLKLQYTCMSKIQLVYGSMLSDETDGAGASIIPTTVTSLYKQVYMYVVCCVGRVEIQIEI